MAATGMPDGWEIVTGTWGTDLDRVESTTGTPGDTLSGYAGIKMLSTTTQTAIISPTCYVSGELDQPVTDYSTHVVQVWLKASNNTSTITVQALMYDADGVADTPVTIYNSAAPTANEWFLVSAKAATSIGNNRTLKVKIKKDNTAFTLHLDSVAVTKVPTNWDYELFGDQTHTADSTWRDITGWVVGESQEVGPNAVSNLTTITIYNAGIYCISARLSTDTALGAGKQIGVRIAITSTGGTTFYYYGVDGDNVTPRTAVNIIRELDYGDVLKIQAFSDNGGTINIPDKTTASGVEELHAYWQGVRVGRY